MGGRRRVVVRLRLCLGAIAFQQRPHMVLGWWEEGCCFYIFFFLFTGVDPVRVLGHGRGAFLGVVAVDLGWTFGWTCGAQKVALPHLRRPW